MKHVKRFTCELPEILAITYQKQQEVKQLNRNHLPIKTKGKNKFFFFIKSYMIRPFCG